MFTEILHRNTTFSRNLVDSSITLCISQAGAAPLRRAANVPGVFPRGRARSHVLGRAQGVRAGPGLPQEVSAE